ncbi:MAG TPA: ATP-binding protein [Pyrinomonadaceae bacterium]|nr:ATP-binding protein [Pyrinomonadaceae bacterium]
MLHVIRHSIRRKLVLATLAATFAALVVTGAVLMIHELRNYRVAGISDLQTQAEILGRAAAPALAFDDPKAASEYLRLLKAKSEIVSAVIYNARGKQFASYTRRDMDLPVPALPESEGSRIEGQDIVLFKRVIENNEILGSVYLRADHKMLGRLMDYLGLLSIVMLLSLGVVLPLSTWLHSALARPILDMAAVTRRVIESRDFSVRMNKTTEDEIGYLADSFNEMLTEVGRRTQALEASNQALVRETAERQRADEELRKFNAELEQRIASRTTQLEAANKEMEAFCYSVSHDLRAPLRAVAGYSQMLLEDHASALDDEGRRKANVVRDEAQRMGQLIDDLLAFSRVGRKAPQIVDVGMTELARKTYEDLNRLNSSVNVEFRVAALPCAKGDPALLAQVWANLISNAMKFSSKRDKPLIEVSAISDANEHIYFVRDNGAGFDPRYQSKLFGVFQRLHDASEFPGTGVGLALVQRIVARHGGRTWAESKPNEGATFYFTLPRDYVDGNH